MDIYLLCKAVYTWRMQHIRCTKAMGI